MGTCGVSPGTGAITGVSTISLPLPFVADLPLLIGACASTATSGMSSCVKGGSWQASIASSWTAEESLSTSVAVQRPNEAVLAAIAGDGTAACRGTGAIADR